LSDFEEKIEEQAVENSEKPIEESKISTTETETKAAELEQVMNNGMQFLAGLFKMSTGKELDVEGQKITTNKETGKITMTFKLPM
jgi:hypothetical protein